MPYKVAVNVMSHDVFSTFSSEELQSAPANKLLGGMPDIVPTANDRAEVVKSGQRRRFLHQQTIGRIQ